MAELSSITLPNGKEYDLKVYAEHFSGTLPISKGGTNATDTVTARINLGLGSAALASTASFVGNDENLPTGAAVQTYVSNLVTGALHYKGTKSIVTNLPTSGNTTGDVWHIILDGSEWAWDGSTWQELGNNKVGAYQTVVGDGASTVYNINHGLNNEFIVVSISITDNDTTYVAPLASVASLNQTSQIGYSLTIIDANNVSIAFTSAPDNNAAKISIISTSAVAEAINNLEDKAPAITNTASGSIAHFEDGSYSNAKSVIAYIEPVQEGSGDPSPDNVRPINGFTGMNMVRTGKNLFPLNLNPVTSRGITFTPNEDGSVTINGTNDGTGTSFNNKLNNVRLKPGTYKKTPLQNDCHILVQYIINSTTWTTVPGGNSASDEFTIEENMDYDLAIRIGVKTGATVDNFTYYPYIYLADEMDLTFESPKRDVINVTFPSEAGTVYGGYVDVTNGKLVVDRKFARFGTNYTRITGPVSAYANTYVYNNSSIARDLKKNTTSEKTEAVCNYLPSISRNAAGGSAGKIGIFQFHSDNSDLFRLAFPRTSQYETAEDVMSWFDSLEEPFVVVFPLATYITYNITPQLIALLTGVNNIWNDCNGDTDVEYKADTKLYIEQLTKPTEDDMTANGNIASDTFFMIGNRLFLSTASITIGETIVPGTNCTELSLADALNSLNMH